MKNTYSIKNPINLQNLKSGFISGIPIALGYFAVSFSLGISASSAGLTPFQGLIVSMLCNASAGEYAGFTLIKTSALFLEVALVTLITNARYLLMSCAFTQKVDPNLPIKHRICVSYGLTDEIFGISMAKETPVNPFYCYGAILVALPSWAIGTALGVLIGNIMPIRIVSALSVALYGMFLASIIPAGKKDKVIASIILLSFILSLLFFYLPFLKNISEGIKTITLTIVISAIFAILFPKKEENTNE